eukprot:413721-Amphidinium_carterae.1
MTCTYQVCCVLGAFLGQCAALLVVRLPPVFAVMVRTPPPEGSHCTPSQQQQVVLIVTCGSFQGVQSVFRSACCQDVAAACKV